MLTLLQLRAWLKDVEIIISEMRVSVDNLVQIRQNSNDTSRQILHDGFFIMFEKQLSFMLVIQLCKLFNNSDIERRNFRKLFNRLKQDKYDKALIKLLRQNKEKDHLVSYKKDIIYMLKPLSEEIDGKREIIHKIKTLRDKSFAHTDPQKALPQVTPEELNELVLLAERIYNEINFRIYGKTFSFKMNQEWSIGKILGKLAK